MIAISRSVRERRIGAGRSLAHFPEKRSESPPGIPIGRARVPANRPGSSARERDYARRDERCEVDETLAVTVVGETIRSVGRDGAWGFRLQ